MTEPVVFRRNHHIDLFRGNTLVIRDGFDFGEPGPFGRVLSVETIDTIFRRAFLPQYRLLRTFDDEITSAIHRTFSGVERLDVFVLRKDAIGRFQHDGHFPDVDFRQHLFDDPRNIQVLAVANGVADFHVDGHARRVGEIAEFGFLRQHEFRSAVVLVNLRRKHLEILE